VKQTVSGEEKLCSFYEKVNEVLDLLDRNSHFFIKIGPILSDIREIILKIVAHQGAAGAPFG
jgi:hypothetical protein